MIPNWLCNQPSKIDAPKITASLKKIVVISNINFKVYWIRLEKIHIIYIKKIQRPLWLPNADVALTSSYTCQKSLFINYKPNLQIQLSNNNYYLTIFHQNILDHQNNLLIAICSRINPRDYNLSPMHFKHETPLEFASYRRMITNMTCS